MRLVFITRKVDRGDALAGFAFSWLEEFAQNLEKLYVICQEQGDISGLPANVEIYSFGKEKGYGKLRQGYQLSVICFQLARRAHGFFIHMHPIYAVTAWLPAKLFGKKIILWYVHKSVDLKLKIAHALVDMVFTASPESFRINSPKVKVVGHGIDLEKFSPRDSSSDPGRTQNDKMFRIISIGRISPVKDYETLIKAAEMLRDQGVKDFAVNIYGRIGLREHQAYLDSLVRFVRNADLEEIVRFQGELNYEYVDEVYNEADLFVNMSATGSIDKAVLEAAACALPAMTSNEAFEKPLQQISPDLFFGRNNPKDLAEKILKIKKFTQPKRAQLGKTLRAWVEKEHNLDNLVKRIIGEFQT